MPKPTDPRSQHPAIQAVRKLLKRYPNKLQYDPIIQAVGEVVDEELLLKAYENWVIRNYNPTDLRWVTDWYAIRKKKPHGDRERLFSKIRTYFT